MKVKIGTTLDPELYRLVQGSAVQRGCSISLIIEEALRSYLRQHSVEAVDRVSESFGQYRIDPKLLQGILDEDPFES